MLSHAQTPPRRFSLATNLGFALHIAISVLGSSFVAAEDTKRLLLIYQGPDGHPRATHEYQAGVGVLRRCLDKVPALEVQAVDGDGEWSRGPQLLADADGAVLFLSQGAKWIADHPRLQDAFARMAHRGAGLVALHWAIGTKSVEPIAGFVKLFGGCHGGPDRKYAVVETEFIPSAPGHPILRGIEPIRVRDEFYYRLKFPLLSSPEEIATSPTYGVATDEQLARVAIRPLIKVDIEGNRETVAWAWQRPDGGRSFGFSGLHFHDNWQHEAYRRLVTQATLWTLGLAIAEEGVDVTISQDDLSLSK